MFLLERCWLREKSWKLGSGAVEWRANLGILGPSLAVESEGLFGGVKESVVEEVGTDHYTCSSLQRNDRQTDIQLVRKTVSTR